MLQGVEARTPERHHHGQLNEWNGQFFVIHHPADSDIASLQNLSPAEQDALRNGHAGWEALNTGRYFKTPRAYTDLLGVLWAGPVRPDLALGMASLPGPDLRLWVDLQHALMRPVPMFCGSDAHGDWGGYVPSLGALVTHIPTPDSNTTPDAASIAHALRQGQAWCVNELLGPLHVRHHITPSPSGGCTLSLPLDLPPDARVLMLHNHTAITQSHNPATQTLTQPGVYHLQIHRALDLGWTGRYSRLWALTQAWVVTPDARCLTHP